MRILVVEDNARLSDLISGGLSAAGYLVDLAFRVPDAEGLINTVEHSLMALHLSLPEGAGGPSRALRASGIRTSGCWS